MTTKEHKDCADIIKGVHSDLRELSVKIGYENAWKTHCSSEDTLKLYAENMKLLGSDYWEKNSDDPTKMATSRNGWIANFIYVYFFENKYEHYRSKDLEVMEKLSISCDEILSILTNDNKIKLLDVGSCYNPLRTYHFIDVLPIDLCPADEDVYKCDFLNVKISDQIVFEDKYVTSLKNSHFDVIVFSLLLEYLPASEQRKLCCRKAYDLLKVEGILIIITPDSKHVGANAKLIKNWRYTLSLMGFTRIVYEKLPFLHCMVFRKSLDSRVAQRWAKMYKEDYMDNEITIPQDGKRSADAHQGETMSVVMKTTPEVVCELFDQLPHWSDS